MELKVIPYQLPETISFNFDELKTGLLEKTKVYEAMVYTEEQISAAKADRANLNRLKKALNAERLKREQEYMQPFMQFKAQIAEIISIIDRPVMVIDKQVKSFEEQKKAEKKQKIEAYWMEVLQADKVPAGVDFKHVFEEKWLNASVSIKSIQEVIDAKLVKFAEELAVIRELPAYAFEAEEYYKNTFNLAESISIAHRMTEQAERKAAYEAEKAQRQAAEIKPEPVAEKPAELKKQWLSFKALLTVEDAKALKAFFQSRNIEFEKI